MTESESPTLEARRAQTFPTLGANEIARLHRFGKPRRFTDGAHVLETGKVSPGIYLVLKGAIRVTGRDGHGHELPVTEHGPGNFSGELSQLSRKPSFVDGIALGETDTLEIDTEQLHALLIAEATLGEKMMRAMILRRVALIESGAGGPVLIGAASSPDVARLRSFLSRNGIPHQLLDPASDSDAQAFIARYAPEPEQLPLAICPDGEVLRNPTESELARCIGMLDADAANVVYDVVIAGAGPAGLAASVYAGSDGLSVLVRVLILAESMSKYLIDGITATPNIELVMRSEITSLSGWREVGVESVTWRNGSGQKETRPIRHVFLFLGADPSTDWLKDCDVALDDRGFVTTGSDAQLPLQTSVPGVFAIGDVRAGSVKRVGAAIGEGAAVIAQIHAYLTRSPEVAPQPGR